MLAGVVVGSSSTLAGTVQCLSLLRCARADPSRVPLLLDQVRDEDPLHMSLTEILSASQRAAALTKQLLAFSRRQALTFQVFDLNDALTSTTSMIERLIGADITLVRDLHHQPCTIRADRGQIDQVILNVAVNAKDAMPDGGRLTIATRTLFIAQDNPSPH